MLRGQLCAKRRLLACERCEPPGDLRATRTLAPPSSSAMPSYIVCPHGQSTPVPALGPRSKASLDVQNGSLACTVGKLRGIHIHSARAAPTPEKSSRNKTRTEIGMRYLSTAESGKSSIQRELVCC